MKNNLIAGKWNEIRSKIDQWRATPNPADPPRDDKDREKMIAILQKQYGYTQEKAESELNKHYSKIIL